MVQVNQSGKIAAAVILYHPDHNFISNLSTYYQYVDRVYVFDNTETGAFDISKDLFQNVEYYHDGCNQGLSKRLNMAAARAIADGYTWLLTMDQDSGFTAESITLYMQCFAQFANKEQVALFGPVFHNEARQVPSGCRWQQAERVITSGALLNLEAFQHTSGFDEALFIDSVDHDFCIQSKLAGYNIIEFQSVPMVHKLGTTVNRASIKTLFIVKKKKEVHSPLRCYYMLRNYLYLKEKYKGLQVPLMKIIAADVKDRISKALFYGRDTKRLVYFLWRAYKDCGQKKMGQLNVKTSPQ